MQQINLDNLEILVVDDNPVNLKLFRKLLLDKNYKVRVATSGTMALESAESSPPDLILLDISMPGMNGFQVCEALKNKEATKNIPVIFLSALKEESKIVEGFRKGGIDFVTKPFKPEILMARIQTHLSLYLLQSELLNSKIKLEEQIKETYKDLQQQQQIRKAIQDELIESEELYEMTVNNLDSLIVILQDKNGKLSFISPAVEQVLGFTVEEAKLLPLSQLVGIEFLDQFIPATQYEPMNFQSIVKNKMGENKHLYISKKETDYKGGMTIYTVQDITQIELAKEKIYSSEKRLSYALSASNEGIWDWQIKEEYIFFSDVFFQMLGYAKNDNSIFDIKSWKSLIHPDDTGKFTNKIDACLNGKQPKFKIEYRIKNKEGAFIWLLAKGSVVEFDERNQPRRISGTNTNIDSQKESEENLKRMANYDFLTNLPNRSMFIEQVKKAISSANRKSHQFAILFLDLDRFKTINDSLGHSAGDILLQNIADTLRELLRMEDHIFRLGGDEFTILLPEIDNPIVISDIASRIIEVLNKPHMILGHNVVSTPSIGVVIYPDDANNVIDLLKKADSAMYHAKKSGGKTYSFFTHEMNENANKRLLIEDNLRVSLDNQELLPFFQPKIAIKNNALIGLEVLSRWQRNGEIIYPSEYIQIAEETGLIINIDEQIFKRSVQTAKQWIDDDIAIGKIAINISALQFNQTNFIDFIDKILYESQLEEEYLELEISENALIERVEDSITTMRKIKDRGISLALDDFGTGYSSLNYLKMFPIDTLKIDMSFIKDIETSQKNINIVKSIIDLAHNLDLYVVAEGVETEKQKDILDSIECDCIQGYLYSKPVSKVDIEYYLKQREKNGFLQSN